MAQAVLFDVGGVLVLPAPSRVAEAVGDATCHPVSPERVHRAHYRGVAIPVEDSPLHSGDHWPMRLDSYVACFLDELAVQPADRDRVTADLTALFEGPAYGLWCWVQEGGVVALRELAERGVRLGVVSNADGTIERQLADAGICQLGPGPEVDVELILDSGVVGVAKPDPAIFQLALDELDLPADEVVFVGDTPAVDYAGATALGIRTVIVDPYGLTGLTDVIVRPADLASVV